MLTFRKTTVALASAIALVGGAGVATAAGEFGPADSINEANDTGSVWICYKPGGANYIQFNGEPNDCKGYPEHRQVAVPRQSGGIQSVVEDEDGRGFTITYLDNHTKHVEFPEPQPGPQGEPGKDGVSDYHVVNETVPVASGESADADVACDEGEVALGGGVTAPESTRGQGVESDLVTNVSGPNYQQLPDGGDGADAWHTVVTNNGDHDEAYLAWVSCAQVSTEPVG